MLSFKEIRKHYSDKENHLPQLVLKEYLQYKILGIIFSSRYGDDMVFMGGTAIRIVYGGDRFSEDLDLDNNNLSKNDFDKLTLHIKAELEKEGLKVEFRNTFQNVYHCYLKFPKLLFSNKLYPLKDEKIMIRLDSCKRCSVNKINARIISKADIFAEIMVYPKELILAQKIEALFKRNRSKGRDIYDIIYLFSLTKPDYNYLNSILDISSEKILIAKMKTLFSDDDLRLLARDVRPFLADSKKIIQIKKFNLWLNSR